MDAAQLATFKADIEANADGTVVAALAAGDSGAIAAWYNLDASPDWTVWRSSLTSAELQKETVWTELIGRSQGERDTYRILLANASVDPSDANIRQAFTDIFSGVGGAATRTALLVAAKRLATNAEKLFSTGTGSNAVPAILGYEGSVSYQDVGQALNS